MPLSVYIVDDHDLLRDGLCSLLTSQEYTVIGDAGDGITALQEMRRLKPDIAIIDINLPMMNGIELTRQISKMQPDMHIIGVSMHVEKSIITEMMQAGARGYIVKSAAAKELFDAITAVLQGRIYLSSSITAEVLKDLFVRPGTQSSGSPCHVLSSAERQIIQLITEGYSSKMISEIIEISIRTLESQRARIMEKLKLDSVVALTKYAIREGLTTPDKYRKIDE